METFLLPDVDAKVYDDNVDNDDSDDSEDDDIDVNPFDDVISRIPGRTACDVLSDERMARLVRPLPSKVLFRLLFIKEMGHPRPLLRPFSNKHYIFYKKLM